VTWKDEHIPERFREGRAACDALNPGWTVMLWTDAKMREFIAQEYAWFLPVYDWYPHAIQRADVIRYFVLYHFGGVYADLDIACKRAWHPLRSLPLGFHIGQPHGISTEMLVSRPRHPFYLQVLLALPRFALSYGGVSKYLSVFASTGPLFMSIQLGQSPWRDEAILLPDRYFTGAKEDPFSDAFAYHLPGRTWFAWDGMVAMCLGETIQNGAHELFRPVCGSGFGLLGTLLLAVALVAAVLLSCFPAQLPPRCRPCARKCVAAGCTVLPPSAEAALAGGAGSDHATATKAGAVATASPSFVAVAAEGVASVLCCWSPASLRVAWIVCCCLRPWIAPASAAATAGAGQHSARGGRSVSGYDAGSQAELGLSVEVVADGTDDTADAAAASGNNSGGRGAVGRLSPLRSQHALEGVFLTSVSAGPSPAGPSSLAGTPNSASPSQAMFTEAATPSGATGAPSFSELSRANLAHYLHASASGGSGSSLSSVFAPMWRALVGGRNRRKEKSDDDEGGALLAGNLQSDSAGAASVSGAIGNSSVDGPSSSSSSLAASSTSLLSP
jgi:hypothetical protein